MWVLIDSYCEITGYYRQFSFRGYQQLLDYYTPAQRSWGVIMVSLRPSAPHVVQCNASRSGWTISILDNYAEWPFTLTSRSFSPDFAIKLLKCGTSWNVHSTACTVLGWFVSYLAQMITSIIGCVDKSWVKVTRVVSIFAVWWGVS